MFPIAIGYWIWVPVEIIFYIIVAYYLKKNCDFKTSKYFIISTTLGLIPLWAFIAPDSNNLPFDGLLYDSLMVFIQTMTLIFLGKNDSKFEWYNWLGVILIIFGLLIMQR